MGKFKQKVINEAEALMGVKVEEIPECKYCGGERYYTEWDAYFQDEMKVRMVYVCYACSKVEDVEEDV